MVASWAEVQTLAGHGWPGCPWRLALPEASGGALYLALSLGLPERWTEPSREEDLVRTGGLVWVLPLTV